MPRAEDKDVPPLHCSLLLVCGPTGLADVNAFFLIVGGRERETLGNELADPRPPVGKRGTRATAAPSGREVVIEVARLPEELRRDPHRPAVDGGHSIVAPARPVRTGRVISKALPRAPSPRG